MVGDISLADHTVLYCVHKYMIRNSERSMPIIRQHKSLLERFIVVVTNWFARLDQDHLMEVEFHEREWQEEQDNMAINNRPRRRRKAPERLNITSYKGISYQQ